MKPTVPPTFAEKDLDYYLRMIRGDFSELEEPKAIVSSSSQKNIVLMLTSTTLGGGDELGAKLLKYFVQALIHNRIKPRAVILLHDGIRLALEGSPVLKDLGVLEEQGVRILCCVVSADEYRVEDQIRVGCIADMDNLCDHLLNAWKVIRL